MTTVAERLVAAGFELPAPPTPAGAYVSAVRSGSLIFTAGQLPMVTGSLITTGTVGDEVPPEIATQCAAQCAVNALAAAATVCDLDSVSRVVKLVGYVASTQGFTGQPAVIDGASRVMQVAFGEAGVHAREAVGVAALPLAAPVEISLILSLD